MPTVAKLPPDWTLPVAPTPVPGESWRSFLRRSATLNDTTAGKLVEACGITADDVANQAQRRAAAQLVGLDELQVRAMTLNSWAGIAFSEEPRPTPNRQGPAWTWLAPTFGCAACATHGVELLEWRLPWITACSVHNTLLGSGIEPSLATREVLQLDAQHRSVLRSRIASEYFAIWRDAVRLAVGLRRCPPTRSSAAASERAMLLSVAAPLASAKSAEARESLLSAWCAEAGVRIVWDGLRRQLGSRAMLNSVDGLAARAWFKRREPAGVGC